MSPLLLLATLPRIREDCEGRLVVSARPIGRHGLHLQLEGLREGLRLDTAPHRERWLLLHPDGPPRIRGGRSAWTPLAGSAARALEGRRLERIDLSLAPPAIVLRFGADVALVLGKARAKAWIVLEAAGERWCLPAELGGIEPPLPRPVDVAGLVRALGRWARGAARGGAPTADGEADLSALLPGLPRAVRVSVARLAVERPDALAAWIGRWSGPPSRHLAGVAVDLYELGLDRQRLDERKARLARLLASERRRARRALAAVEREEESAPDPRQLDRQAEALLAAGPRARELPDGAGWEVPDPRRSSGALIVRRSKPGLGLYQAAERLYALSRRHRRGITARAARRRDLARRLEKLESLAQTLGRARTETGLGACERELEELGLAVRSEDSPRAAGSSGRPARGATPRLARSPSGLRVLVGRTARQNDELTFRLARPEDLWFHVEGHPGAHVVLRCGREEPPEKDLRFAAELAAAWSRAPEGERVEVHVARRRHLRRPKGGAPGQVLVRRGRRLTVVVPARPAD